MIGNSASNTLNGGTGADTMKGGAGDDTYIVDNTGDVIVENASEGTDTVQSSVTYTLSANVENLTLTGAAAINASGNDLANILTGNDGNNVLDGKGGNDVLAGGHGSDTYIFGRGYGHDTIEDYSYLTDTDTVKMLAGISPADILVSRDQFSNLILRIAGTDDQVNVRVGFQDLAFKQVLFDDGTVWNTATLIAKSNLATSGNDYLTGTTGVTTLSGGLGDDNYIIDNASVVIVENPDEGQDTVQSSVSYTLSANIENLVLTGSSAINATGNDLDNTLSGNNGNNILDGGIGADTMSGGKGDDIYIVDNAADVIYERFNEGVDTVQSSITYTLGSNLENLTLTGAAAINGTGNSLNNVLKGNSANNVLDGGAGNDTLDGGAGADTLIGGAGDDTYIVDNTGDVVTENAGEGTDTVQSSISYTLGSNLENLTLTGSAAINGTGNELNNILVGNAANNILDGGVGVDTMSGGAGNDIYIVDNTGDVVIENAGEGVDTVQSSVTYTLGSNIENLTLTGTGIIDATGNNLNNLLIGNSANNILNGGAGADTMKGGLGDDVYIVDNTGDVIIENAGEGTDTVQSSITYTLGNNLENLTLTGSSAINGTGNSLNNVLLGNSANNILDGGAGADTMKGGAGNDIYIVDNTGDVVIENAGEGTDTVQSSVTYTLGSNIENLTLTGSSAINGTGNSLDNVLKGNAANNILIGGAGNDTLDGGAGADTMKGGVGDDIYIVDNTGDVVTENAGEGLDIVQSSVTYTLTANVENLTLTGSSTINATGNALNNVLIGNGANNTLDGGIGADTMKGGAGDDIYIVDNTGDVVTENAGEGVDTVQSSVTYTLSANVENLTLTGSGAIDGTGNDLNNVLIGNSSNNTLDGGAGADTMKGGTGDDIYIVDNIGDVVTENAGEGTDTVQSSITYTLGGNLENLTLTGSSAINGTGNSLDNVLKGNAANNILIGGAGNDTLDGGAGADTLIGGAGDDIYIVDNTGDVVTENAGEGTDTVQSSITYTLGSNLENLTLTGSSSINATGNALNNVLIGNGANNTLDGGTGADTMRGGAGDDIYIVDNTGDVIVENAGEGTDTVQSSITYTLTANVENLTLTGYSAINGTGNELDNVLIGNDGNNILIGGAGNDTLDGGKGCDIAMFSGPSADYRIDKINGNWVVTDVNLTNGNDGVDVLKNIETLRFSDKDFQIADATKVNSTTLGDQVNSKIALLKDDGYIVIWNSINDDGTPSGIYAQRYDAQGNVEGKELKLAEQGGDCSITGLKDGGFLSSWTSMSVDGNVDVYAQRYDGNSQPVNSQFRVNTYTDGWQGGSVVTTLNNGNFVVSWMSYGQDGSEYGIYAQTYDSQGLALGSEVKVNTFTDNSQWRPSIAALSDGGFIISWLSNMQDGGGVYAQRFDSNGLSIGSEFKVNAATYEDISSLNTGGFVSAGAIWGHGWDDPNFGLHTQRFDAQGHLLGSDNIVKDAYCIWLSQPSITGLNDGGYAVMWDPGICNPGCPAVQRFDAQGNEVGNVIALSEYVQQNSPIYSDIIGLPDGGFVTTWTSESWLNSPLQDSSHNGIYIKRFDSQGNPIQWLYGSLGADTINVGLGYVAEGGPGDDIYIVNDSAAQIMEFPNEGIDTVQASVTYTLGDNFENLTLTGSDAINATGNSLNNIIIGNGASNIIVGNGGNDTLTGGAGADKFIFNQIVTDANIATITDFNTSEGDLLELSGFTFSKLMGKTDLASNFRLSTQSATGGDKYIVYNRDTGQLFYDATGDGSGTLAQFALLQNKPIDLSGSQFTVI